MSGAYLRVYNLFPEFLKRRINPLDYAIHDFVKEAADKHPQGMVLDAGAGEARFSALFSRHRYVALDLAVGDARWDYSKVDLLADLEAMPIAGQAVGLALNIQVLEHVRNPAGVLAEIYRVLQPGGTICLTAPQGWHEHQQPNDYYRFTRYILAELLRKAGFRDVKVDPMGGYFHYLGHRLTYIPKVLFPGLPVPLRVILFPVELACLGLFCFLFPIACYYLDPLDRRREFTLCYKCTGIK